MTSPVVLPCLYIILLSVLGCALYFHRRSKAAWSVTDFDVPAHYHWLPSTERISPFAFMCFRVVVFNFFLATLLYVFITGTSFYKFYTIWNFTLCTSYFGVASWSSVQAWRQNFSTETIAADRNGSPSYESESSRYGRDSMATSLSSRILTTVQSHLRETNVHGDLLLPHASPRRATVQMLMLETEVPSAMLVVLVTWTFLLPQAINDNNSQEYLHYTSYVMHGTNLVALLLELLLNRLPFHLHHFYLPMVWVLAYGCWEQLLHALGGGWAYSFLATGSAAALAWYPALCLAHVGFHALAHLIANRFRTWLTGAHFTPDRPESADWSDYEPLQDEDEA